MLAVYPGRRLPGVPRGLPEIAPERIPAPTLLEAMASREDTIVGTETAREIVRGATRVPRDQRRLVIVTDPATDDHQAPLRADADARRTFWAPLRPPDRRRPRADGLRAGEAVRGEHGGADRAAEVAERGEPDRGRSLGGEQVRVHGVRGCAPRRARRA